MTGLLAVGAAAIPSVFAGSEADAATLSGQAAFVSDYRYRGLSLSEGRPAVQAKLNLDLGDGAYAEAFASTIRDRDISRAELDATLGDEIELAPRLSLDLSATYYAYPSTPSDNYIEGNVILSSTRGNVTASAGLSIAPPQRAMRDDRGRERGNVYAFTSGEISFARTPAKLIASVGYERGAFDARSNHGKWDWSVGASLDRQPVCLSLAFVDSDAAAGALVGSLAVAF